MDQFDHVLLAAMAVSGVIPNSTDQQHRLDKLAAEGLCVRAAREGTTDPICRLNAAGKRSLDSGESANAEGRE